MTKTLHIITKAPHIIQYFIATPLVGLFSDNIDKSTAYNVKSTTYHIKGTAYDGKSTAYNVKIHLRLKRRKLLKIGHFRKQPLDFGTNCLQTLEL